MHVHVRDLRATIAQQRQIAAHAERIRDLYMSAAASNENAEQQIAATIEAGCRILGLRQARCTTPIRPASRRTASRSAPALARLALGVDRALAIDDVRGMPELPRSRRRVPFVALIGTPIDVSGERYGTSASPIAGRGANRSTTSTAISCT